MADHKLPTSWREVLDELGISAESAEADDASASAYAIFSSFSTRGFVRATALPGGEETRLRVQLAIPTDGFSADSVLGAIRREFSETFGGSWSVAARDPDWELEGTLRELSDKAAFSQGMSRLESLAEVASANDLSAAPWLSERIEGGGATASSGGESTAGSPASDGASTREPTAKEEGSSGASAEVFESIGDGEAGGAAERSPTAMLDGVGLGAYEIQRIDERVEIRVTLDAQLPLADREHLGRALAHALGTRYDLAPRPMQADDTPSSGDHSEVGLTVEPADTGISGSLSVDEIEERLGEYFDRLERFDELGVKLADFLGIGGESETSFSRSRDAAPDRRRGSTRREEERESQTEQASAERRDPGERGGAERNEAASEDADRSKRPGPGDDRRREDQEKQPETGFVLGVDESDADTEIDAGKISPETGLKTGDYRDPRLMREDATTSLVDVVLRHPGYAEEKMGHNLSILLSVDYPDAMDLVENAPRVIAWGVARERGMNFKSVIEKAGGKVVLVEPGSLSE